MKEFDDVIHSSVLQKCIFYGNLVQGKSGKQFHFSLRVLMIKTKKLRLIYVRMRVFGF